MARILVVEDEADLRQVLEFNLAQHGYEVETAATGAEALRSARERKPDLVLLDIMLPDCTGLDVCRQIKSDPALQGVAIVMLTARG